MAAFNEQLALADVYVRALFELAQEQGVVDEVRSELEWLAELSESDENLAEFWRSEALNPELRAETMEKLLRGRLSDLTLNTLLIINRNGRVGLIGPLLRQFTLRQQAALGQVEATATSAVELDEAQQQQIRDLAVKLTGKKPLVDFKVDADLLGGLILQIEDKRYDNSLRTHLDILSGKLRDRSEAGLAVEVA